MGTASSIRDCMVYVGNRPNTTDPESDWAVGGIMWFTEKKDEWGDRLIDCYAFYDFKHYPGYESLPLGFAPTNKEVASFILPRSK